MKRMGKEENEKDWLFFLEYKNVKWKLLRWNEKKDQVQSGTTKNKTTMHTNCNKKPLDVEGMNNLHETKKGQSKVHVVFVVEPSFFVLFGLRRSARRKCTVVSSTTGSSKKTPNKTNKKIESFSSSSSFTYTCSIQPLLLHILLLF